MLATVVIVIAGIVVLYLLGTIPLTTRHFSLALVPTPIRTSLAHPSGGIVANDGAVGSVAVPRGSDLSGSWSTTNGTVIGISILYGPASYSNDTLASGSFRLDGGSPFSPSSATIVWFDIVSPSSAAVTISGSYTAPLL